MNGIQTAPLVWHNGNIVSKEKLNVFFDIDLFMSTNLVETFYTSGTEIMFANDTISRIKSLISIYKFDSKLFRDNTGDTFINETRRLLIRNFCYKTARCFLIFYNRTGSNKTEEFLFLEPSPSLFSSDKILKHAIVSSRFLKPSGNVMNLPTVENEFRKVIRLEFEHENADDCIILNQAENIVESYFGNIFLIDQDKVTTPSVNSGCSLHLLRGVVINGLRELNFHVSEPDQVQVDLLFEAKEILIAGATGIYSLRGIEYKRYFDTIRKKLIETIVTGY